MKQQVTAALRNFLTSVPPPREITIVDCLTITLTTGQVFRLTNFDRDVVLSGVRFGSYGSRLKRGAIKNTRGVEQSSLTITIAPDSNSSIGQLTAPPPQVGSLSLTQALIAGLLREASVRLESVYNPVPQSDGSVSDNSWGSIIKFMGVVGPCSADRGKLTLQVVSRSQELQPMWPPFLIQSQCRWRLFDSGCTLNPANFQVSGSVLAGSTQSTIYHALTQKSGYFSLGRLTFTSGANNGVSVQIKTALGSGAAASYRQTVLNDGPYAYYTLSGDALDYSGNAYNGSVYGGVSWGQPSLLPGDTGTAAIFDGGSGYINLPVPKPPKGDAGVSFEFWYMLAPGVGPSQPTGVWDTDPNSGAPYSLRNNGQPPDTLPGFEWWPDKPYVGFTSPGPNVPVHVVVVFRGQQTIDVYFNGQLYGSQSSPGKGHIGWADPFPMGYTHSRTGTTYFGPGYLQHFAIYQYPISPNQALTHYQAAITPPGSAGQGAFFLLHPLPYAPAAGDTFDVLPGCDKSLVVCQNTFNNVIHHGGFEFVPAPEQGL